MAGVRWAGDLHIGTWTTVRIKSTRTRNDFSIASTGPALGYVPNSLSTTKSYYACILDTSYSNNSGATFPVLITSLTYISGNEWVTDSTHAYCWAKIDVIQSKDSPDNQKHDFYPTWQPNLPKPATSTADDNYILDFRYYNPSTWTASTPFSQATNFMTLKRKTYPTQEETNAITVELTRRMPFSKPITPTSMDSKYYEWTGEYWLLQGIGGTQTSKLDWPRGATIENSSYTDSTNKNLLFSAKWREVYPQKLTIYRYFNSQCENANGAVSILGYPGETLYFVTSTNSYFLARPGFELKQITLGTTTDATSGWEGINSDLFRFDFPYANGQGITQDLYIFFGSKKAYIKFYVDNKWSNTYVGSYQEYIDIGYIPPDNEIPENKKFIGWEKYGEYGGEFSPSGGFADLGICISLGEVYNGVYYDTLKLQAVFETTNTVCTLTPWGTTNNPIVQNQDISANTTVALETPSSFKRELIVRYFDTSEDVSNNNFISETVSSSIDGWTTDGLKNSTVYLYWTGNGYPVTLYSHWNEGTCTTRSPNLRNGYTFANWRYYDVNTRTYENISANTSFAPGEHIKYTGQLTEEERYIDLVGQWTPIEYTVTYNTDDGNTINSQDFYITDTIYLPKPIKIGYTFLYWQPTSNVGNWETTEKLIDNFSNKYGTITLKAIYRKNILTLKYIVNDNEITMGNNNDYELNTTIGDLKYICYKENNSESYIVPAYNNLYYQVAATRIQYDKNNLTQRWDNRKQVKRNNLNEVLSTKFIPTPSTFYLNKSSNYYPDGWKLSNGSILKWNETVNIKDFIQNIDNGNNNYNLDIQDVEITVEPNYTGNLYRIKYYIINGSNIYQESDTVNVNYNSQIQLKKVNDINVDGNLFRGKGWSRSSESSLGSASYGISEQLIIFSESSDINLYAVYSTDKQSLGFDLNCESYSQIRNGTTSIDVELRSYSGEIFYYNFPSNIDPPYRVGYIFLGYCCPDEIGVNQNGSNLVYDNEGNLISSTTLYSTSKFTTENKLKAFWAPRTDIQLRMIPKINDLIVSINLCRPKYVDKIIKYNTSSIPSSKIHNKQDGTYMVYFSDFAIGDRFSFKNIAPYYHSDYKNFLRENIIWKKDNRESLRESLNPAQVLYNMDKIVWKDPVYYNGPSIIDITIQEEKLQLGSSLETADDTTSIYQVQIFEFKTPYAAIYTNIDSKNGTSQFKEVIPFIYTNGQWEPAISLIYKDNKFHATGG